MRRWPRAAPSSSIRRRQIAGVSLTNLVVNLDPFTLQTANGASPATGLRCAWTGPYKHPRALDQELAHDQKHAFAGGIIGGVGGFFAGGFLGAHIEGDRCNCDDPGVRGFLIGAPIRAVAGDIVAAKFLF